MKRILGYGMLLAVVSFTACRSTSTDLTSETSIVTVAESIEEAVEAEISEAIDLSSLEEPERPYHEGIIPLEPVTLFEQPAEPIANSSLPRVDITFEDIDYKLDKENYESATVTITNAGEYDLGTSVAGIRIRGNSTAEVAKRPLRIKFDEKVSLFGRDSEKSWTLLANIFDKTLIHNYVAYDLYDYLTPEDTFTALCVPVDVYVNGGYQGVYTLSDQINTGSGRVDINNKPGLTPEDTDYLIEHDYRAYYDDNEHGEEGIGWFWMKRLNECFEVKSPDTGELATTEYTDYIKQYMDETYEVILNHDWTRIQEYIDVDSFIYGFMSAEIVKSQDIAQSSVYFYKKADGRLTFAVLWDCDLSFGSGDRHIPDEDMIAQENFLFGNLMQVPEFRRLYIDAFNRNYDKALNHILTTIDDVQTRYHNELENEFNNWESKYDWCSDEMKAIKSYDDQIAFMKDWIKTRMNWLHKTYNEY